MVANVTDEIIAYFMTFGWGYIRAEGNTHIIELEQKLNEHGGPSLHAANGQGGARLKPRVAPAQQEPAEADEEGGGGGCGGKFGGLGRLVESRGEVMHASS